MRLPDYLAKIGVTRPVDATIDTLRRIHLAHRETFLFENLTIQEGGSISVEVQDLERKFLDEGRGGYCFEHNTLLKAALTDIGFTPITLLGRVRRGPPDRWCRTHMVLRVPGVPDVLCDVGFGGLGLLEPIELRDGATAMQGGITYTLRCEEPLWVLSMRDADGNAIDLYEFTNDPQTPWDVVVANHFTSTHPESVFRKRLTVQRTSRHERIILRGELLTRYVDGHMTETSLDRSDITSAVSTLLESRPRIAAAGR